MKTSIEPTKAGQLIP